MANDAVPNATSTPASFGFTCTDLDAFGALSTSGKCPGSILYAGATSTTEPTGVTDAHPLPVTTRRSDGVEIGTAAAPMRVDPTGTTPQPVTGTFFQATQPVSHGAGAQADGHSTTLGATTDAAAAGDTSNVGLIALFKRLLQRITTLLSVLPSALSNGFFKVSLQESVAQLDTELPAAAALADAAANPTTPIVGAAALTWNGASWDRLKGTATNGAYVDHRAIAGTAIAVNSGNKDNGTQRVVLATDQPPLSTPLPIAVQAGTAGGWTPYSYLAAAGANQDSTVVKSSGGQVGFLVVTNTNAAARYLKVYDKATGPTSADTPKWRFCIPGNTAGAGISLPSCNAAFANGISFRLTTGAADSDANAVAANEVILNLGYA